MNLNKALKNVSVETHRAIINGKERLSAFEIGEAVEVLDPWIKPPIWVPAVVTETSPPKLMEGAYVHFLRVKTEGRRDFGRTWRLGDWECGVRKIR